MISVDWATLRLYAFSPSDQPKACNDRHCFSTSAPSISCASSILTIAVPRCMYNALITAVSTDSICSAAYVYHRFDLLLLPTNRVCNFLSRSPLSTHTISENDSNFIFDLEKIATMTEDSGSIVYAKFRGADKKYPMCPLPAHEE